MSCEDKEVEIFELPEGVECKPNKTCSVPHEKCYFLHEGLCGKEAFDLVL